MWPPRWAFQKEVDYDLGIPSLETIVIDWLELITTVSFLFPQEPQIGNEEVEEGIN